MLREQLKFFVNKPNKITNLAETLLHEYQNRRFKMMKNSAMYATVYLDRRYAIDLCDGEIQLAKITLCDIWNRVKQNEKTNNAEKGKNNSNERVEEDDDDECHFDMDQYIRSKRSTGINDERIIGNNASNCSQPNSHGVNYDMSETEFLLSLHEFETKNPILDSGIQIIDFFEQIKNEFPEIYIVSTIFFGIPPSQAAVERSFSHFAFVFSKLRNSMNPKLLENVLLIRLNKAIAKEIFDEDNNELDKKYKIIV